MTEREILIAASGLTETFEPKAQFQVETKFVDIDRDEEIQVDAVSFHGPVLNFFRNTRNMNVDIQFDSSSDPGLIRLVTMLKEFCIPENSMISDDTRIPVIVFTAFPKEYGGEYFVTGVNGSWVVIPSQMNRLPDTVRFIFDNRDFHTYRLNDSEIDVSQLERDSD